MLYMSMMPRARSLCKTERFQKNPEQLYTGVLNTLFSEPDEG